MRADEIREMSLDDIRAKVADLERERFNLRFRSATEPLNNPMQLRMIRRDIARLKTVLTEKQRTPAGTAATRKAGGKERTKNG